MLLAMRVRLALAPDEPDVLKAYLDDGLTLITVHGQAPWKVHERSLSLLLETASDALLPVVWRMSCLDQCYRPLGQLGPLVDSDLRAARLRTLSWRLARFSLHPTDSESQ
ncbi:MAG: hypothetical protein DI603_22515 [Roseateles depolymerans]|uniref:Uncharacterized protein n=1 Tax=Roseateles depolymerans TaxID=76731 RepID=A0A2W5D5T6_9BURK|nr:MAG: hypothetical protein DI603_22515 [Roseateles depolymerans]